MKIKKGDRVVVTSHEYDTCPDGTVNDAYGFGTTGVVVGFRNNRFHGRQATVQLDDGSYVDWTLKDIGPV